MVGDWTITQPSDLGHACPYLSLVYLLELVIYGQEQKELIPQCVLALGTNPSPGILLGSVPTPCKSQCLLTFPTHSKEHCVSPNANYLMCSPNPTLGGAVFNISLVGFLERTVCLILRRVFEGCLPLCPHKVHWSSGFGQGDFLPAFSSSYC